MIIDMHTHIFPDSLAERAIRTLQREMNDINNGVYPVYSDGTLNGLKSLMNDYDINLSVVMPIATKPEQTNNINSFAEKLNKENSNVISFGTVHPLQSDWESVLEKLADEGFVGIKLHPEFQNFDINGKEGLRVLKKADRLGLVVMLHSGVDLGFTGPVHCTPKMLKEVISEVDGSRIIAAHLGGFQMWDDVEQYLVGTGILMDTAYLTPYINPEQYKRIIINHGADKILFGSDLPWEAPQDTLSTLSKLGLDDESMELIMHKNAEYILNKSYLK